MSPKKKPAKLEPPKKRTLEQELDIIRDHHHDCYHDSEIADDVIREVERVLERFGLLQLGVPDEPVFNGCWFCGSKDYQLEHKHFCVETGA